jgi:predicted metal-dependent HD superfamily phosphohydrolase
MTNIRWNNLLLRLTGNLLPHDSFGRLVTAYSEPHRHYHTTSHIEFCLAEFDAVAGLCDSPDEVEFGIWLHDVVYDPRASDNEEQSARIAGEILGRMDCPPKLITSIRELILATRHIHPPPTPDASLLVDIDLSILGQPPDVFGTYEMAIRAEYSWVSEEPYRIGRSRVLRGFLDKSAIYCTDGFEKKYGHQARKNIMKALAALEQ